MLCVVQPLMYHLLYSSEKILLRNTWLYWLTSLLHFFSNYIFLSCNLFFCYFKLVILFWMSSICFQLVWRGPLASAFSSRLWATTDKPPWDRSYSWTHTLFWNSLSEVLNHHSKNVSIWQSVFELPTWCIQNLVNNPSFFSLAIRLLFFYLIPCVMTYSKIFQGDLKFRRDSASFFLRVVNLLRKLLKFLHILYFRMNQL